LKDSRRARIAIRISGDGNPTQEDVTEAKSRGSMARRTERFKENVVVGREFVKHDVTAEN